MRRKKGEPNFNKSEPEFLISCMDRHPDWAVIVCLIGGGQEINTGEAGITEWIESLIRKFPEWRIHVSSRLADSEYAAGGALALLNNRPNVRFREELHLSVSMRSFRAEKVSLLVKQLLDLDEQSAIATRQAISSAYPIAITRSVPSARQWLRQKHAVPSGTELSFHRRLFVSSLKQLTSDRRWTRSTGSLTAKRTCGHPIFLKMWPLNFMYRGLSRLGLRNLGRRF